jgi:DNA polymerase elongation subunit (family B)
MTTALTFFPYAWHVKDAEVHVYGFESDNQVALVRLQEFTPYVYVKLPAHIDWTPMAVHRLLTVLKKTTPKLFKTSLMYKRPLYYAHLHYDDRGQPRHDLHPYLFVAFETERDRRHFAYAVRKDLSVMGLGNFTIEVYEHNATPVLQLSCLRGISTADWFQIKNPTPAPEPVSRLGREYAVNWKSLAPLPSGTHESAIPEPLILSYDIECNFHDPNKFSDGSHANDVVFQISCVFGRQSHPKESWETYLLTLGNPDPSFLDNVTVLRYKKEFQLLMGFNDLIVEKNPQLLIGYNIFKFDIPFLYKRAMEQRVHDDFVRHGCTREKCKMETIRWSSSAYSNQEMNFIDLQGRMTIDLLTLIQRDFNLENYKLDTVAEKFLGTGKDPLNHYDIFNCYKVGMQESAGGGVSRALGLVGKYCVKDSVLVLELFEKFQYWYSLTEMAKICQVPHAHLFLYGQQLKVFSQVYKYCYAHNIVVESGRFKVAEDDVCTGAYVFTPEPGLYDNVVSFDFCLTGDTQVSLSHGLTRRLDQLVAGDSVLGYKRGLPGVGHYPIPTGLQVKGMRDTIRLVCHDGHVLTCTPDHKILDADGLWIRADETLRKAIRVSVQFPEDWRCPLESQWSLLIANQEWSMERERDRILALCRISGHIHGRYERSCPIGLEQRTIVFETWIDAHMFCLDIELVLGIGIAVADDNPLSLLLPKPLVELLRGLDSDYLFLHEEQCPSSVIREFLGGFFGVDFTRTRPNRHPSWINTLLEERFGFSSRLDCLMGEGREKFMRTIGLRYKIRAYLPLTAQVDPYATRLPYWTAKVDRIVPNGLQPVYDIEVRDAHSFVANGLIVHNCSLYPSIIISHNIDFTTLVAEADVERLGRDRLTHIAWGEHLNCPCAQATVTKDKEYRCKNYSYFWLKEPSGVLPTIIRNLLDARKSVRKQMKDVDPSTLLYDILNKRQLAYKVSSNSMYGALTTRRGYLPFMPAGMCVTAVGRQSIERVSQIIQQEHQGQIVYGDSVTGETPVLVRDPATRRVFVRTIESLATESDWTSYPTFRMFDLWNVRLDKQYALSSLEVWSDQGWTRIRKVIRHKTQKRLYTVGSARGVVCVTEDHSLLTADKRKIRPRDVRTGQKLLYTFPTSFDRPVDADDNVTPDQAYREGVFCRRRVPAELFDASPEAIRRFIRGFRSEQFYPKLEFIDPALAQDFYLLLTRIGESVRIYTRVREGDDRMVYELKLEPAQVFDAHTTLVYEHTAPVGFSTFVYDLETASGRFQAGVGQMIVKNTDSNYVRFPHLTDLQEIWNHSLHVSEEVSRCFPDPMRLEFEEHIYARYLILSKKRYLYLSCTPDGVVSSKIENKGVLLKRRDNSKIVRDVYEALIRRVLERQEEAVVMEAILGDIARLYARDPPPEAFQMSKSVKGIHGFQIAYRNAKTIQYGDYVVPRLKDAPEERQRQLDDKQVDTDEQFYQSHLPGAVQLALRMRARGQHIESGSRLSYVVTRRVGHKSSVSDKMEEIEFFKLHFSKQMIDVLHYLHLLINPVEEVLTVMYGSKYHQLIKDMYKYRIKYDAVVDELFKLARPLVLENARKILSQT